MTYLRTVQTVHSTTVLSVQYSISEILYTQYKREESKIQLQLVSTNGNFEGRTTAFQIRKFHLHCSVGKVYVRYISHEYNAKYFFLVICSTIQKQNTLKYIYVPKVTVSQEWPQSRIFQMLFCSRFYVLSPLGISAFW